MEHLHCRNVVLGAGATGSAAAYQLARRGEPVTLVEQFRVGHDRGSSHGDARIARHSYADPTYARLMVDAFKGWRDLEADAGQNLFVRTGGVSLCPPGVDYVAKVAACLDAAGIPHRRMAGGELNRITPAFAVPEDHDVVFEPDAGMLAAARIVATHVDLARRHGGEGTRVIEDCPIRRVDLDAERPTLLADDLRVTADRLIVAAGPWVGRLLPGLVPGLRATRQQVIYFRPADLAPFSIGRLPTFIVMGERPMDAFYGMPEFLGGGVKIARHGGPEVDPDDDDRSIGVDYRDLIRWFLRGHLPALADAPIARTEVCRYTVADDEHFRVGPWPGRPDVLLASPCSGHGFKFSNLIGRVLADLAIDGRTDVPIAPWRPATAG